MAGVNVRHSAGQRKAKGKPKKPSASYPLTPHASGQFCKKIRGKIYYFGSDPEEALRRYVAEKDALLAGLDPHGPQTGETVEWLCNVLMDSHDAKRVAGELASRAQDDYLATCKRLTKFFGRTRSLHSLGPLVFGPLKTEMQKKWGPTTVNNEISRINVILNYSYAIEALPIARSHSTPTCAKFKANCD